MTLKALGYTNVRNYFGGSEDWVLSSLDDVMANLLSTRNWTDGTIVVDNIWANRDGRWSVIGDDITRDPHGHDYSTKIVSGAFLNHDYLLSNGKASITWIPEIPVDGDYEIYVWLDKEVSSRDHTYTINYSDSKDTITITPKYTGWHLLAGNKAIKGSLSKAYQYYRFNKGMKGDVILNTDADNVYADAVMFYKVP